MTVLGKYECASSCPSSDSKRKTSDLVSLTDTVCSQACNTRSHEWQWTPKQLHQRPADADLILVAQKRLPGQAVPLLVFREL